MATSSTTEDPWKSDGASLLPRLHTGDLKVVDVAKSLIDRIGRRDSEVKAWVWLSPSQILQQAQQLDDIPPSQRGPLFGLPIAVKDVILTKDMPTQYNSRLYETQTPINMDANAVITLRKAGALIVGKTSTTEFASSKQGNWHQNLTANPHDVERTPGGSSSGSGAAVGDYQVQIALGTQTGGSIVRPASFNGCYGFKYALNCARTCCSPKY
jgi:Asp-tRNA(Asn)/Glu-tRNA(Gln) amidotransferase A subunit family amidase